MSSLADSLIARMAAQRDLLQEMDDRFSAISAHAASPDGSVTVEVDGLGAMTRLWLLPQALTLEPEVLAKLIVDTASSAARAADDRQELLITELNERMRVVREAHLTLFDGTIVDAPDQRIPAPTGEGG